MMVIMQQLCLIFVPTHFHFIAAGCYCQAGKSQYRSYKVCAMLLSLSHKKLAVKFAFLFIAIFVYCCGCRQHGQKPTLAFYYWRTQFHLSPAEQAALQHQALTPIYMRFFDVDLPTGAAFPQPIAPVQLTTVCKNYPIIPVVFIKNRVFERTDTFAVQRLARNVYELLYDMGFPYQLSYSQVQFDCDWTAGTRTMYFYFLTHFAAISNLNLSATIRLHQVKYRQQTGIPPVDTGVLMYYNMGSINAGPQNSIYEPVIAGQYSAEMRGYPLPLQLALPIFSWGIQLRDGKVVQLLNKINSHHFAGDTNFIPAGKERLIAREAGFKSGYYFQAGDVIKLEQVSPAQLLQMAAHLNKYIKPKQVIFYDLDSINLSFYDKAIFQKVLAEFN
jgi:hypothetical protein